MTSSSPGRSGGAIRVPTAQHPISLTNPDAVVAALPYLLGFRPERSMVLLWITEGRLTLTQRVDLPAPGQSAQERGEFLDALLQPGCHMQADSLIACVVSEREPASAAAYQSTSPRAPGLAHVDLIEALAHALAEQGLHLLDALLIQQMPDAPQRWRSFLCQDDCCPERGRQVPESIQVSVAAAFAMEGIAVAGSRADVVRSLQSESGPVAEVTRFLAKRAIPTQHARLEQWRTQRLRRIRDVLGLPDQLSSASDSSAMDSRAKEESQGAPRTTNLGVRAIGDVLQGVGDARVRDCVLWSLSRTDDLQPVIVRMMQCLRAAPDPWVPAMATCVAIATWLTGDGARATMALDRALAVSPNYSLARLLDLALRSGMPPQRWAAMMAGLTEAECRGGNADEGGLPSAAVAL